MRSDGRAADALRAVRFEVDYTDQPLCSAIDPLIILPERAECHRAAVRNGVVQMNAIAGKAG